jgi:hypothetical protein
MPLDRAIDPVARDIGATLWQWKSYFCSAALLSKHYFLCESVVIHDTESKGYRYRDDPGSRLNPSSTCHGSESYVLEQSPKKELSSMNPTRQNSV